MSEQPTTVGLLPLRNSVMFPGGVLPLTVGRARTISLLIDAVKRDRLVGVLTQCDAHLEDPGVGDLHRVGTLARLVKLVKHPEHYEVVLQGLSRFRLGAATSEAAFLEAAISPLESVDAPPEAETAALRSDALELVAQLEHLPPGVSDLVREHPGEQLADLLVANLDLQVSAKQEVLEQSSFAVRTRMAQVFVRAQLNARIARDAPQRLMRAASALPALRVEEHELSYPGNWTFLPPGHEELLLRGGLFALLPLRGDVGTLIELVEANLGDRKQLMLKALTRLRVPGGDDVGRLREPLVASHVRAEVLDADEAVEPALAQQVLEFALEFERSRGASPEALASIRTLPCSQLADLVAFRYLDVDRAEFLATLSTEARARRVLSLAHTRRRERPPLTLEDAWSSAPGALEFPREAAIIALATPLFPGERCAFRATDPHVEAVLEYLAQSGALVGIIASRDGKTDQPATRANVYDVGTLARATSFERGAGFSTCRFEGLARFRVGDVLVAEPSLRVETRRFETIADATVDAFTELRRDALAVFALTERTSVELARLVERVDGAERFADLVSGSLGGKPAEKQAQLEDATLSTRLARVHALVGEHLSAHLPRDSKERLLAAARGLPLLRSEHVLVPGIGLYPPSGSETLLAAHRLIGVLPARGGEIGTIGEVVDREGESVLNGLARFRLLEAVSETRHRVEVLFDAPVDRALNNQLHDAAAEAFAKRGAPSELRDKARGLEGGALADWLPQALELPEEAKAELWAIPDATARVKRTLELVRGKSGLKALFGRLWS